MNGLARVLLLAAAILATAACDKIPADRYGVARLRFEGVEELDAAALAACLATRERERVSLSFGLRATPDCGDPPFTGGRARVKLYTWPWTDWPLFDRTLWERDLDRILRWYQARGYPDARVVETRFDPEGAEESDVVERETECRREPRGQGCKVRITVVIDQGEPVHVRDLRLELPRGLDASLVRDLERSVPLREGERFDEHGYEAAKEAMAARLAEAGHCRARVDGSVRIHRGQHWADVDYEVYPGPVCEIGRIALHGYDELPPSVIVRASYLEPGQTFRPSVLRDAQQGILALGSFSVVEITPHIPAEGNVVPIDIRVEPAEKNRFMLGAGIQSGLGATTLETEAQVANQWDVHALGRWESRRLFGGTRRLLLEERPRLVWNSEFPRMEGSFDPRTNLGNLLLAEFEQAGFLEARTSLLVTTIYDFGPDPFEGFVRHAVRGGVEVRRAFWDRRLRLGAGLQAAAYQLPGRTMPDPDDEAQDWFASFFQETAELDLRDVPVRTRKGAYFALRMQQTGYGLPADWRYLRFVPDARAYAPLPGGLVLAGRVRLGMILVQKELTDVSQTNPVRFGPDIHRFRGGGPISNRGFLAQRLGDGEAGGSRLWEASVELRMPLTENLWLAAFGDAGDSSREERFRWDYPQVSVGGGIRYYTIVGPIRLDAGFRIPSLQVLSSPDERVLAYCEDAAGETIDCNGEEYRGQIFGGPPGAIHLTIGDAF